MVLQINLKPLVATGNVVRTPNHPPSRETSLYEPATSFRPRSLVGSFTQFEAVLATRNVVCSPNDLNPLHGLTTSFRWLILSSSRFEAVLAVRKVVCTQNHVLAYSRNIVVGAYSSTTSFRSLDAR